VTPTVYNREIVRRTLAALDPGLGQPHTEDGLILGIHFGRRVEIEYESVPDSSNSEESQPESQPETQPGFSQARPERPPTASHFVSNRDATLPRVIRLSKKQYDEFIAQEQAREQAHGTRRSN
jgi:hypothetical protein